MADAMAAQRLAQDEPAAEDGVLARLGSFNRTSRRSSPPKPASASSRRAAANSSSPTRMRRGKMPIEPSSTLMF